MSVPALRFKEFNSEWAAKKLSDVASRIGDGLHSTPLYDESGDYYFVNGNNLTNNKIEINESTKRLSNKEYLKHKVELSSQTILMSINGTIGNLAFFNNEQVVLGKSACYINLKANENKHFVFNLLKTSNITSYFDKELTGSTIKNLSLTTIKNTRAFFPCHEEQTKIANFLTTVDEKITQLTQKHDLLTQYKKGVMQKIFSQEIRFKDDDGQEFPEWEEVTLSKLGKSFNGLAGKAGDDFGEGKPYITYKQIFDDSKIDVSKFSYVQIGENEKQNQVQYGDVFFTTSSETPDEVGFCSVLLDHVEGVYLNSFCFGYRISSFDTLHPNFARFVFKSTDFRRHVVLLAQGSTRFNISKTSFMEIGIKLPSIAEQTKIANFLTAIDDKITASQTQLQAVKQYKKGLLQQMFV